VNYKLQFTSWTAAVALFVLVGTAHADVIVDVTLNTTVLTTAEAAAGPFSVAFQLDQGSQADNNTATISDFSYGAGGGAGSGCPAALSPCIFGGAGGDISSSVELNTSSAFNALVETFTPGASLSFLLDLTTNVDSGGTPDVFAFGILDSSGSPIPTLDPTGADTLLTINIDSANPSILTYATDASSNTLGGSGPTITMDAPIVSSPSAVPEPRLAGLFCVAVLLAGTSLRRRKTKKFSLV
jgi:hypothetical protein